MCVNPVQTTEQVFNTQNMSDTNTEIVDWQNSKKSHFLESEGFKKSL